MLKRIIASIVTVLALALGGVAASAPASAATTYRVYSQTNSTCFVQYRSGPTSNIYTLLAGNISPTSRNAAYFSIPGGCNGYLQSGLAIMPLNPTTWYATATYGTRVNITSLKN